MKQLVYKQQADSTGVTDNLQNPGRRPENQKEFYGTPINRANEKLAGLENQIRSADRKGMSKRRDQEDMLRSVAQQYSNKVPSGSKYGLQEQNKEKQDHDLDQDLFQYKKRNLEQKDRKQLISMAGNQIRRLEQQSSTSNQNIGQKSFKQQTQQKLLEDMRSSKLNTKDNGLVSEEEFFKMNEQRRESKTGGQKRRTKLTLGRQGNKTQQVAEKYMKSNQSDNDREIVSSYLNVPINPDESAQERNPVSRQKSNKASRVSNGVYKNNQNYPLMKKSTEVYHGSNRMSQVQHQSQGENRTSLKQKLSENSQKQFPSTWKQHGNKLNLTQGDNAYSHTNQKKEHDREVDSIIQNATSALSHRNRSQSKNVVSSAKQQQNQVGQQNLFQTANNTQRIVDDFGNIPSLDDLSKNVDMSKLTNRNQDLSSNQIHLTMDHSIKNDPKSADQSREVLQQRNDPQEMQKYDLEATEKEDMNDQQQNNKFTGIFGFLNNVKKNLFQQEDEFNEEDGNLNEEKSGSQHSNDSPNAGAEVNSRVNINGANHYQLKLKRAGVGMSPQRDKYYNRGAAYKDGKDGRAPKNYGDSYMLTMSQHTIENRESQVQMPFNAHFDKNFDKLEQIENDNLRMKQQKNNEHSPELDNSVVTDNNTDLRRIQRRSQQETNGLHVLQSTKMARSQHTYLGGQTANNSQVLSAKNINQKPMFKVQSQSNKKENKRKMSHVIAQPNIDDNQKQVDQIEDAESSFRINYQDDDVNWQEEIDHRQVKHAANLQMLKNQKRRSDLNLRLSQQIMNGSELSSSPYKGDQFEHLEQREHIQNSNRSRVRENKSSQKNIYAQERSNNEYMPAGRQVNLFGQTKNSGRNKSTEKFATPKKSSQQLRTETSPPLNQEDFDQLYNLQDGDSSDNNLQQNQNHKIVHQDGLQIKKTVDTQGNVEPKTPVQNSRISNYVPQGQSNQNSYLNIQTKSSCSFEQKQLMHRGEEPQADYNYPEFSTQQQFQRRDNTIVSTKSNPANIKGKIDAAFQNEVTQQYDQNLNKFLQYQPQLKHDGNAYTEINMTESHMMRNTANFNGETDQDLQDYQNYNSAKPSDDKIVMKNRGHTTKNIQNPQPEGGSFLELYGKNHIKSHEINERSLRHQRTDLMGNNSRSPNGTDDNKWLFDGLQHSLNRTQRQTVMSKGDNSNHVKSFHIDRTNNMVQSSSRHAQALKQQSSLNNLPPSGQQQQIVSSQRTGDQEQNNDAAKYTIKSKSPKNKVSSLQLLLRGKSQNRIESRGKHQSKNPQGEGLQDHGFFPQSKVRDKSNPPSSRYNKAVQNPQKNDQLENRRGTGNDFQDTLYDPSKNFQRQNTYQQRRGGQFQQNGKMDQGAMVQTMFSFFKNIFSQENRDASPHRNHRQSAETKASSGQSALQRINKTFNGWSPQEALEIFGHQLTEFEKIELGNYLRIYTIGEVRRENQYSIADKDGFYKTQVGEQLGYRYMVRKVIDKGSFGQVVSCIDYGDPNQRIVAAKIGKNKKFDVDNANIEIKFLSQLNDVDKDECADIEGHDRIVKFKDSFNFRQHVVIIFEHLHMNLYKYISLHKKRKPVFDQALLKRISYQMIQGLKYMKNKKVIHCDMKPENIIFTDQKCQNIKIVDFGASCTDCTSGFFYVQSRYYRAPEIVLGLPYDHAVDMWSLGCIIYELLTGRPIFPAKDENELLEFFTITVGLLPDEMVTNGKNYKKFFKKQTSIFGSVSHELIRSKKTILGSKLKERSEPIRQLLSQFQVNEDIVDFIEKCLVYDVECRITPHDALFHQWFFVQKPIPSHGQQQVEEQGQ